MQIINNLPFYAYQSRPGLNNSGLKQLARSAQHFHHYKITPGAETPALTLGKAFHELCLQPGEFEKNYIKSIECNRKTKAGKELWEAFQIEVKNKTILKADDYDTIHIMRDALYGSKSAKELLTGGVAESSIFWKDSDYKFDCKGRADYLIQDDKKITIIDLKTTTDAAEYAFLSEVGKYKYYWQEAFYRSAFNGHNVDFLFIAVEKNPPYGVAIYKISDHMVRYGWNEIKRLRGLYNDCLKKDDWPGYPNEIIGLKTPKWMKK